MTSLAEDDFDDFDDFDFDEEEEFFDDGDELEEMSEEEFNNAKQAMNRASGKHEEFTKIGDYYIDNIEEDPNAIKLIRYDGIDWDVIVPDTVDDRTVTILDNTFSNNDMIETVVLPDTLRIIDNMTFWSCKSLKEVTISEGLTTIGRCAFGGCDALEKVVFPESLEVVGEMVFIACNSMKEFTFGSNLKSIGSNAFTSCANLEKITVPRGTEIAEDAFVDCPKMGDIVYYDPEE
jgi:hypothetical protein